MTSGAVLGGGTFITGGAGYCGSALVPRLLAAGQRVTVYGSLGGGRSVLPADGARLTVIAGDIREIDRLAAAMAGHDTVINLAAISDDGSVDHDPERAEAVIVGAFEPMVAAAKTAGIRRFVHASTSSVYGLSEQPRVAEDHPLCPVTRYNAMKARSEALLWPHCDDAFTGVIFRPAAACGYAPRMRWSIAVNLLTRHALARGRITVLGGAQTRPLVHVEDYCDAVMTLATAPAHRVQKQVFNVGAEILSVMEIAERIKAVVDAESGRTDPVIIETVPSDDIRSYRLTSEKIERILGFRPRLTVRDAIGSLVSAWRRGCLADVASAASKASTTPS